MGKLFILALMSISLIAGNYEKGLDAYKDQNYKTAKTYEDFYLKIDLTHRETSKDSNSQRYIVEVKNKDVHYTYSYSGYPGSKKRSKNYRLSDEELNDIIRYIKDKKIDVSTEEKRSTKSNGGVTMRVHLSLLLKLEGKTTESKISGNVKIFRGGGKIEGELIRNKNYVNSVKSLIGDLER